MLSVRRWALSVSLPHQRNPSSPFFVHARTFDRNFLDSLACRNLRAAVDPPLCTGSGQSDGVSQDQVHIGIEVIFQCKAAVSAAATGVSQNTYSSWQCENRLVARDFAHGFLEELFARPDLMPW